MAQNTQNTDPAQLLGILLGNIGKGAVSAGQTAWNTISSDVGNLASGIGQGFTGNPVSQADNTAGMKALQQALQGTQTMQQNPQFNPYQEGVKKALKQAGEAHATQAIQAGVPADHIVEQAGLNPQPQIDPMQVLSSLVAMNSQSTPNQQTSQNQPQNVTETAQQQPQGQQNQTSDYQSQVNNAFKAQSLLGKLLGGNVPNDVVAGRLNNLAKAQSILGQEPLQQSTVQASDLAVKQAIRMAKEVPLSQEQQATATAGMNTATIQAFNDASQRINSQIDNLTKQYEAEQKTLSPRDVTLSAITGKPLLTPRMKQIQSQLANLNNALGALNKQGALLKIKNPAQTVPVHTQSQINTYNQARAAGMTPQQAAQKAGF